MKLKYKKEEKAFNQSFFALHQIKPHLDANWHFHEEYELIYIIKGSGIRIVGDNISDFSPLELVLVGSCVPHLWKNDECYDKDVNAIIIKFNRLFNGQDIFSIPEFSKISKLLKDSKQGITFNKKTIQKVSSKIESIPVSESANRLIHILEILHYLSESENYTNLSSPQFTMPATLYGENRLNHIINYISENYNRQIDLDELADEAAMTRSSLCRFFKSRTNKTIFQFLNEFRVGKASQLLIDDNLSISDVCFKTGFNSIASFIRVFKTYKNVTPSNFKKNYFKLSLI